MKSFLTGIVALFATSAAAAPNRRQENNFSLLDGEKSFTFSYSTSAANDTNWIGLYTSGKGPEGGEKNEDSLLWDYTPGGEGELFLDANDLAPGKYDAYLLAKDGYESLADSIEVSVPLRWLPSKGITLQNAKVGEEYKSWVGGLVGDTSSLDVSFSIKGDSWASINGEGIISGTPSSSGDSIITVEASASGTTAEQEFTVPVVGSDSRLVSSLTVMTYNLWHQGTQVNGNLAKQVAFLSEQNIDIVGLQESSTERTQSLADALGWWSHSGGGSTAFLSRYDITEEYADHDHGVAVKVDLGSSEINLWDVHLAYDPYGPYDFCFDNMSVDEVLDREESSGRGPQIRETLELMEDQLSNADSIPVLLFGDFNAPSHLDWTEDTASAHCDVGAVDWPTSKVPTDAGMTDSLRVVDPDPVSDPHITWSPIFKDNEGREEPMDRIDFVYHKGGLTPESGDSLVKGEPKPQPDHKDNEWTSDHAVVVVKFSLD